MFNVDSQMLAAIKEYGPWCIGWIAWLYERRQTTLAHRQLHTITNVFLRMFAHDRAAIDILESSEKEQKSFLDSSQAH